jgi:hypothetical protein
VAIASRHWIALWAFSVTQRFEEPHPQTARRAESGAGSRGCDKGRLWSPREDVGTIEQKFNKTYLDEKYSIEEREAKFSQWEGLMRQLFMRKR